MQEPQDRAKPRHMAGASAFSTSAGAETWGCRVSTAGELGGMYHLFLYSFIPSENAPRPPDMF